MEPLVRKRDGSFVPFDRRRIASAVFKAVKAVGKDDRKIAEEIADEVALKLYRNFFKFGNVPHVEQIQDLIEDTLIAHGHGDIAKAYILYREKRKQAREIGKAIVDGINLIEDYLTQEDWRVQENSNMNYSLQGLNFHISSSVVARYWLTKLYPAEIGEGHREGDFHVHDLGILGPYCVGWDLYDLLLRGFGGVPGKVESTPAKHFRTALGQIVNFFYTLQGEAAGAQAFSNFDTLLAPFVRYDNLSYREVKQALQEFLFNVNVPTRVGFQTPFTNLTMDLKVPETLKDQAVVIGGALKEETYADFQEEMDMINQAFCELMMEGDAKGRIFTFPIPTYNISADFDWDNEKLEPLWEMTRKYGIPYFANFVNSDMDPNDARSMCCRLRLDNRELRKRLGGLFGSAPLTGSIGVVTLNMPRIAYLATCEEDFFDRLIRLMELAKVSLEIKRKVIEDFTEKGLYPYSKVYLAGVKEQTGAYWTNHFSTIGIIGMNEACLNFVGEPIYTEVGKEWAKKVLLFMREKIFEFQEETGNLYNLEATPAEGASYRLAKIDKKKFSRIITAGTDEVPYYTNSVHLPVNYTDDIFEILTHQDDLQTLFTGGTVVHLFIGEEIPDTNIVKQLVRTIVNRFKLPYFSITPTFSVCPVHGYIPGKHVVCPYPHTEKELALFGREVELNELDLATLADKAYRKIN
ncbi:anaerobic ribonucleoside-triphosphate reductase [Thermodesulfatator indicus DSM 15286]|uniref:Anaerobic ribonucleoside-triphosphate reductase n=1 Tax=Thermodesulfatator indicus (strain DSM 15286 / JCM 11887 / CIR29812) TaxID=667014 RepID=F8A8W2_THEID|nr:ribonucleoside triphosphate reductase [Thermodesulfatator indicus]AEH44009.1 anaerobic ribonucleoside-triphosphate reductase [Thermodesulfatator indicus DSM 15286]